MSKIVPITDPYLIEMVQYLRWNPDLSTAGEVRLLAETAEALIPSGLCQPSVLPPLLRQKALRPVPPPPKGEALAHTLQRFFLAVYGEVRAKLRGGARKAPSLKHWVQPMTKGVIPLLTPYFHRGGIECTDRLNRKLRLGRRSWTKAQRLPVSVRWDLHNPKVTDAVYRIAFDFCDATLDTIEGRVDQALEELRSHLVEGLARGEAYSTLSVRVQSIFGDPAKSYQIAATEASRAMHGGQYLAAKESGLVRGKLWIASADACPECIELSEMDEVPLDDNFEDGEGTYGDIPFPPAHPSCMCTWEEVVDV